MALRFSVDNTLGKLLKWLRLLGFDARFVNFPATVNQESSAERILLTRTRQVARGLGSSHCLLIQSDRLDDQLQEVVTALKITIEDLKPFSRCLQCNSIIQAVEKESVWSKVPDYIWETKDRFSICGTCERIYWSGSHLEHSMDRIQRLFDKHPD